MKTKDVVFLCQFFYPEYITSALLPFQTATYLAGKGMSVTAICGYPKEYLKDGGNVPKNEVVNSINIKRIKYLQLERGNMIYRMINYLSFVFMMFLQLPEIGKHRLVVVYSNPPILPLIALLAKKIYKTKIVFVSYDVYPEIAIETQILSKQSISTKFMSWLNSRFFKLTDLIVALSNEMRTKLIKTRPIRSEKVTVIENWATEESNYKKNHYDDKKYITITYLGNMGIPQDFETIIDGLKDPRIKNNPKVKFIFAGHGNQKEKIKNEIKKHKISNVEILDYLSGVEYEQLVGNSDVFILSLKKELTGLAVPSKFYTYLLMNKYILSIISKETDIAKYTDEYRIGSSIDNGDIESFVRSILSLIENPDLLNIEETIYKDHFNKTIQLEKYYDKLSKLIKE